MVDAMLWETLILNVINRIYFLEKLREDGTLTLPPTFLTHT